MAMSVAAPPVAAAPIAWNVLVAVNYGFDDLFTNWLTFFERLHTGMPVHIVAEDEAVRVKYAGRSDVRLFSSPSAAPPAHAARLDARSFWDPVYQDMMARRPAYIREALTQLGNVIFTDVDTVWLRDPRPHLLSSGADFQMLAEGTCGTTRTSMRYNNGFMAMRNTRGAQAAWRWVGDAFTRIGAHNVSGDQELLNKFFERCVDGKRCSGAAAQASVRALPQPAFARGCHFPAWQMDPKTGAGRVRDSAIARPCVLNMTTTAADWGAVPAGEGLVVAHATWVVGKATKIRLLETAGLWCADAASTSAGSSSTDGARGSASGAGGTQALTLPSAASAEPHGRKMQSPPKMVDAAHAAKALSALVHGQPIVRNPPTGGRGLWADTSCAPFEVQDFPSGFARFVAPLTADGAAGPVKGIAGEAGGKWTSCTHLSTYGMVTAPFVQRFLAFGVQPTNALEIGCGLGTTADYLARFTPGGSERQFDLVYSIEVAEHLPPQWQQRLVHLMRDASRGLVVFSAARPAQPGIGHVNESMRTKADWISAFEGAGMVLMPRLSATLSRLAFPERACDIALNVFVMRKRDAPPALANESAILERGGALLERDALFPQDEAYGPPPHAWRRDDSEPWSRKMQSQCVNRGIKPSRGPLRLTEAALWPELDALQTILQKRPDACS